MKAAYSIAALLVLSAGIVFAQNAPTATPAATSTAMPKPETRQTFPLWTGQAPLQQGNDAVDIPTLTAYLPPADKVSGSVLVVLPGGSYSKIVDPKEGAVIAQWLNSNGITAFVLRYRLGPKYHHPVQLDDVQRSIRYVRANAKAWGLDPTRVGVIGFSAGGHLASTAATHFDAGKPDATDPIERVSSRPDVQMLLYPVITLSDEANVHQASRTNLLGDNPDPAMAVFLSSEKQVTADTPPAFIAHSIGDATVPLANSDAYVFALMKNNIPFEYIREPLGGHGFGLKDTWSGQAIAWLHTQKF